MKPSPAPWTVEPDCTRSADDAYYYVQDANGQTLFDSFTSDVKEIHSDYDESGTTYWDEQGKVNLTLAAAAPDLLKVCEAASKALRSYQYGNSAPALAEEIANAVDAAIAGAKGQR